MIIKECKVTNNRNVIVQIPKLVVKLWELKHNDKLIMEYDVQSDSIVIKREACKAGS